MRGGIVKNIKGCIYCSIWITSILFGYFFLYLPLLPLLFIKRKWFRRSTDILFVMWESFNMALTELIFNSKVTISGDYIRSDESSIFVVNHRTRVDWNYLFVGIHKITYPANNNAKFVLKQEVRMIPGVGWTLQCTRSLYICRSWSSDEDRMNRMLDYLSDDEEHPYQLILFPEGTNLTNKTKVCSDKYAMSNGQKPFEYLLFPRTTGFGFLANKMRERKRLDAIYDITLSYPDVIPETERDVIHGNLPQRVHMHVKRHPCKSIPTTLIGLEKWLLELWREKEKYLEIFYTTSKTENMNKSSSFKSGINHLHLSSLMAWALFFYITFSWIFSHPFYATIYLSLSTLAIVLLSKYTPGIQELELKLHNGGFFQSILNFSKEFCHNYSKKKHD
uniref:Lysocardiolipin acyltransferase 1like [Bombus impatiens] n=1 Tax=Lepeophtheirus salmonis TaxID=72036 RepID=A0A0K2SVC8_LEPSM